MTHSTIERRHVDTTANIERTREELLRIGYSLSEIDSVINGYPEIEQRLRIPLGEELGSHPDTLFDRKVTIYELPSGYDATGSSYRRKTFATMEPHDFLYGMPDPDFPREAAGS